MLIDSMKSDMTINSGGHELAYANVIPGEGKGSWQQVTARDGLRKIHQANQSSAWNRSISFQKCR